MGDMADSTEWFSADYDYEPGDNPKTPRRKARTKKASTMNTSNLIAVLQATKGVKTCKVKFSPNGEGVTYKTTEDLPPGAYVVCEMKGSYSIGKVIAMDKTPDVLREGVELKWVVQLVDEDRIKAIREEEETLAQQMMLSEAQKKLQAIVDHLNINVDMPALGLTSSVVTNG